MFLQLLITFGLFLVRNENLIRGHSRNPDSFSKYELKAEEFLGSRWMAEQKSAINVYQSVEIIDATLSCKNERNELALRLEFNLHQKWLADSMEFPEGLFKDHDPPDSFVTTTDGVFSSIWKPGSYVSSAKDSHSNTIGQPLSLVHIFKNSTIVYKVRMFTTVVCSSNFFWYPLDVQSCELVIESFKYHDNFVRYLWFDEEENIPVVIHSKRKLQYQLLRPLSISNGSIARGGASRKYPFVLVRFRFERKLGNNLIQTYIPTLLVILLSWFSFWLGMDVTTGRISLLITCMLTLVTMHRINDVIPPVDYITLMDVWMVACMAFVFFATSEFIAIKYIHGKSIQRQKAMSKLKRKENTEAFYKFIDEAFTKTTANKNCTFKKSGLNFEDLIILTKKGNFLEKDRQGNVSKNPHLRRNVLLKPFHNRPVSSPLFEKRPTPSFIATVASPGKAKNLDETDSKKSDLAESERETSFYVNHSPPTWEKIDKLCLLLFPCVFCFFNLIYWPVLIFGSSNQSTQI